MNAWELAAAVSGGCLVPCAAVCALATAGSALVALEVAGALLTSALMALAEGLQRQPFIDLALLFALLSVIGSLAYARMMESDL